MAKYQDNQITLHVDAFEPDTLPLSRFAEYVADLAALLGSPDVYFVRIGKGSANFIQKATPDAIPQIRKRVEGVNGPTAADDAAAAYRRINMHLLKDGAVACLRIGKARVLEFPGRRATEARVVGPVIQQDYLDGQLVRAGGLDQSVPVHIRDCDGQVFYCTATIEKARELGKYLYGPTLRVFGVGTWYRRDSRWKLEGFRINDYAVLNDQSLTEAIADLRSIDVDWHERETTLLRD